jgi:hypothetical protein
MGATGQTEKSAETVVKRLTAAPITTAVAFGTNGLGLSIPFGRCVFSWMEGSFMLELIGREAGINGVKLFAMNADAAGQEKTSGDGKHDL